MEPIVTVSHEGEVYAMFFHAVSAEGGVKFLTEPEKEFQVGVMERPTGHVIQPHTHPRDDRTIHGLTEFLYIESGKILVKVYDKDWNVIGEDTLSGGDFLLFFRGGHGIEVLEAVRMIEVKQGPFLGNATKKSFSPAA